MENLGKHLKLYRASLSMGVLYTVIVIVVSLITTPYILGILDKKDFAFYSLAREVIFWMGIVFMGQRSGFKMQVAGNYNDLYKINQLFSSFLLLQFFIACLSFVIGFVIGDHLNLFGFDNAVNDYGNTFRILVAAFSITTISTVFSIILSVYNKDQLIFFAKIIIHLIQTVILFILLKSGMKASALATGILVSEALLLFYLIWLMRKTLSHVRFHIKMFNRYLIHNNIRIGMWVFLGFVGQLMIRHTNLFFVTEFIGLETVTLFVLSSKLYLIAYSIIQVVMNITISQQIRLFKNDILLYKKMSIAAIRLFIIGISLLAISIYVLNGPFIGWWVGSNYFLGNSYNLILFLIFFLQSINLALRSILNTSLIDYLQIKYDKIILFTEGICNVLFSVLLGYHFLLYGILLATLFTTLMVSLTYLLPAINRAFSRRIFIQLFKQPILLYYSMCIIVVVVIHYLFPFVLFHLSSSILLVLSIWIVSAYPLYAGYNHLNKLFA